MSKVSFIQQFKINFFKICPDCHKKLNKGKVDVIIHNRNRSFKLPVGYCKICGNTYMIKAHNDEISYLGIHKKFIDNIYNRKEKLKKLLKKIK